MNVQDTHYSYHPFVLETARNAVANNQNSWPTRIAKGVTGAVYDIYVKNPYDLTIGNCKYLIGSAEPQSTGMKIAIVATVAFGTLYTFMLYGATVHASGRSLQALGHKTNIHVFSNLGEKVKIVGRRLFMAGAVPLYGAFYALPKKIAHSIPKVADFVATKVSHAAQWVFTHVLTPLWEKVILPVSEQLLKGFEFVARKIGVALNEIADVVASTAQWVFTHVLTPLWEKVILPVSEQLLKGFEFVARKIADVAQKIFQDVMIPAWNQVILPALKGIESGVRYVAQAIGSTLTAIAQQVSQAAQWVFQNVIIPTFEALAPYVQAAGEFLNANVIQPLGILLTAIAERVGAVSQAIFDGFIVPVAKELAEGFTVVANAIIEVMTEISRSMSSVWNQFAPV